MGNANVKPIIWEKIVLSIRSVSMVVFMELVFLMEFANALLDILEMTALSHLLINARMIVLEKEFVNLESVFVPKLIKVRIVQF